MKKYNLLLKDSHKAILLKHPNSKRWNDKLIKRKSLPDKIQENQPFTSNYKSEFHKTDRTEKVISKDKEVIATIFEFSHINVYGYKTK